MKRSQTWGYWRKLELPAEVSAVVKQLREHFVKEYGREPKAGDPVHFDRVSIARALALADVETEVIYAFAKTHILKLGTNHHHGLSNHEKHAWNQAIEEYFQLIEKARK